MSKFVRFLSRRRTGKGIKRGAAQNDSDLKKKNKHIIVCKVVLLDGTDVTIELPRGSLGDVLYQRVFYHLDLLETSYFGLQFTDSGNVNHWLDTTKKIKKQVLIGPPYTLRLRVKFFPTEPSALKEELTRYQFFQQCKGDILSGSLPCPDEAMCIELAAYALQSELGDFDEEDHTPAVISEFRFVPDQSEEMELDIYNKYKSLRGQRMTPDKAELQYLHKVKWLDLYGVDMHYVLGKDGLKYKLGLTPTGVLVFEGEEKIGLFYWPKITKFDFKSKKLILVVVEDNEGQEQPTQVKQEHTFVFRTENPKACKHLWKCAIENHTFFRVVVQPHHERSKQGFIRLGSRFRYSGRTQFEQLNRSQARRSVRFERQPSKRFSRRASLEARERTRRRKPMVPTSPHQSTAISNSNAVGASSPLDSVPSGSTPTTPSVLSSPNGANINGGSGLTNGSITDPSSPMDRLDNLISSEAVERHSGRGRTPSGRERSPPTAVPPSLLEHSEAAQAKIKGLSDTPEPPPRPTKDVNLYQNNQVKMISTKEKVPIEIKSNILKARADEERHSGGATVMQEDDDVSTESEDESPASPINHHQKEHILNGSRIPRHSSTSSNKSMPSPVINNKGYSSLSRDKGNQSPKRIHISPPSHRQSSRAVGSKSSTLTGSGELSPLLANVGAVSPTSSDRSSPQPEPSVTLSSPSLATDEVSQFLAFDDNANTNPFFSSPEIRAFFFGTADADSILGELSNITTTSRLSSSRGQHNAHIIPPNNKELTELSLDLLLDSSPLVETIIDSPINISPVGNVAPIASCDDDGDLSSPGECSTDGSKAKRSSRNQQEFQTNGDINASSRTLPTAAPRKYEKRVCVTTEL